jgi:hypothetical protein
MMMKRRLSQAFKNVPLDELEQGNLDKSVRFWGM